MSVQPYNFDQQSAQRIARVVRDYERGAGAGHPTRGRGVQPDQRFWVRLDDEKVNDEGNYNWTKQDIVAGDFQDSSPTVNDETNYSAQDANLTPGLSGLYVELQFDGYTGSGSTQVPVYMFNARPTGFWARIDCYYPYTSSLASTNATKWAYGFTEVYRNGVNGWAVRPNGRTANPCDGTGVWAMNSVEANNQTSGIQGNSIDDTQSPPDGGTPYMLPVRGRPVVWMTAERAQPVADDDGTWWYSFSYVNQERDTAYGAPPQANTCCGSSEGSSNASTGTPSWEPPPYSYGSVESSHGSLDYSYGASSSPSGGDDYSYPSYVGTSGGSNASSGSNASTGSVAADCCRVSTCCYDMSVATLTIAAWTVAATTWANADCTGTSSTTTTTVTQQGASCHTLCGQFCVPVSVQTVYPDAESTAPTISYEIYCFTPGPVAGDAVGAWSYQSVAGYDSLVDMLAAINAGCPYPDQNDYYPIDPNFFNGGSTPPPTADCTVYVLTFNGACGSYASITGGISISVNAGCCVYSTDDLTCTPCAGGGSNASTGSMASSGSGGGSGS